MKYLLDASALIALGLKEHAHRPAMSAWAEGRDLVVCPLAELAFLRIVSGTYKLPMTVTRNILADCTRGMDFLPCDMRALDGLAAPTGGKTTDFYMANLAEKAGMRWATLDTTSGHPAAEVIPLEDPAA